MGKSRKVKGMWGLTGRRFLKNLDYVVLGFFWVILFVNTLAIAELTPILRRILELLINLCYMYFAVNVIKRWIETRSFSLLTVVFGIIAGLALIVVQDVALSRLFILLHFAKNHDVKKILRDAIPLYIFMLTLTIVLSFWGILPMWVFYRGEITRYGLGFSWTTTAPMFLLTIVLAKFYVTKGKMRFLEILLFLLANIALMKLTDTRLDFVLVDAVLLVALAVWLKGKLRLFRKKNILKKLGGIFSSLVKFMPAIFMVVSLVLSLIYNPEVEWERELNKALSNRIYYQNQAVEEYEITPLGGHIEWYGWGGYGYVENNEKNAKNYNFVDNSYMKVLLDHGVWGAGICLWLYTVLMRKYQKEKNMTGLFVFAVVFVWCLIEPRLINVNGNIFIILLGEALDYRMFRPRRLKRRG